jgi:hypothetical protein
MDCPLHVMGDDSPCAHLHSLTKANKGSLLPDNFDEGNKKKGEVTR